MADVDIGGFRQCAKCGATKLLDAENYPPVGVYKDRRYLSRQCRDCVRLADRKRWKDNPERRARHNEVCAQERVQKPELVRERHKRWRDANPQRCQEMARENHKKNFERRQKYGRKWRSQNRDKCRVYRRNRQALERKAEGTHTPADIREMCEAQQGICFYCESEAITEIDHFVPLIEGGSNWPENLRGSCLPCNRSKADKLPWVWKPERFSPP